MSCGAGKITCSLTNMADFPYAKEPVKPVAIRGEEGEMVLSYKYLGIYPNKRLD